MALLMRIPLAVLGNVGTVREVALFSAAQRFGDAVYILAISSGFALLPGISYLAQSDPPRARRLMHRVLLAVLGLSVLVALAALPLAEPIMRAIFGSDYAAGADLLRIVLIGIPAYATLGVCWYAVVAFDGEARLVGIGLLGLAVCAVLSAVLIPLRRRHRRCLDLRGLAVRDGRALGTRARAPARVVASPGSQRRAGSSSPQRSWRRPATDRLGPAASI